MGIFWTLTKFAPKLGILLTASKPLIRVFANGLKAGYDDVPDEKLKAHFKEFETRVEKLEATIAQLEMRIKRLTTALYLIAGVAIAALVLSVIKLA